ncbi:MAG: tetratricopeptide repeat protein [Crocinitomicaceae bacterium]
MKKILLIAAIALVSIATAQKGTTSSAGIAFKNYWKLKLSNGDIEDQASELADAKAFIDKAYVHEETKADPKTLMYYGKIYIEIPFIAATSGNTALVEVDAEKAIEDGFKALKLSMELDEKERYVEEIQDYGKFYWIMFREQGVKLYDEANYEGAAGALLGAATFGELAGQVDSSAYLYGGLAAFNAEQYDLAREGLQRTVEIGYNVDIAIPFLAQAMQNTGKSEEAEKMLLEQVEKYPENKEIMIALINFYIEADKKEEAVKVLEDAITLDPENTILVYTSATIYENMGEFEKSEAAYTKVLELEPNHIDALSGLGGIYFNKGADLYNEANALEFGDPNYDKMTEESKEYFKKAVPYLEKAAEFAPNDCNVWVALRDAYGKAGDVEKFKTTKAKAEACVNGVEINGQTIKVGMTQSEVGKLLGEPTEIISTDFKGRKLQTFVYGESKINFADGAVFTVEQ